MKITVDSNIVFSAILNTKSHIGQIITIGERYFNFHTTDLLKTEIINHKSKIQKITGYSDKEFTETYELILSKIRFVNEALLPDKSIEEAIELTKDIDINDTLFVALSNYIKAKLWTGDIVLINGLKEKGFSRIITTREMYEIFIQKELKRKT